MSDSRVKVRGTGRASGRPDHARITNGNQHRRNGSKGLTIRRPRRQNNGMDEFHPSASDPSPQEEDSSRRHGVADWMQATGMCAVTPALHKSIQHWTCSLAKCEAIKHLEKLGKSSLIDSFSVRNIPLGAHRAVDVFHDPVFGPIQFARQHGAKKVATQWAPHMASDVMTKMSLPLPGTSKLGTNSLLFKLYAKGLVNVKTVMAAPGVTVLITETLARSDAGGRLRGKRSTEPLHERLQKDHAVTAVAMGVASLGALAVAGGVSPAVIALGATSVLSGAACGTYYVLNHREEIAQTISSVSRTAAVTAKNLIDTVAGPPDRTTTDDAPTMEGLAAAVSKLPSESGRPKPQAGASRVNGPSRLRLGIAAAVLAGAIVLSS